LQGWIRTTTAAISTTTDLQRKVQPPMNPNVAPSIHKNSDISNSNIKSNIVPNFNFATPKTTKDKEKVKVDYTLRQATAADVNDIYRFVMGQLTYENRFVGVFFFND